MHAQYIANAMCSLLHRGSQTWACLHSMERNHGIVDSLVLHSKICCLLKIWPQTVSRVTAVASLSAQQEPVSGAVPEGPCSLTDKHLQWLEGAGSDV